MAHNGMCVPPPVSHHCAATAPFSPLPFIKAGPPPPVPRTSRPSSLPIRPRTPTARATESAHTGVGRHPRHPPAVLCQWPNDGDGGGGPAAAATAAAATKATVSTTPLVAAAAALATTSTGALPTGATAGSTSASTPAAAAATGAGALAEHPARSVPAGTMATAPRATSRHFHPPEGGLASLSPYGRPLPRPAPAAGPHSPTASGTRRRGRRPATSPTGATLPPRRCRCRRCRRSHPETAQSTRNAGQRGPRWSTRPSSRRRIPPADPPSPPPPATRRRCRRRRRSRRCGVRAGAVRPPPASSGSATHTPHRRRCRHRHRLPRCRRRCRCRKLLPARRREHAAAAVSAPLALPPTEPAAARRPQGGRRRVWRPRLWPPAPGGRGHSPPRGVHGGAGGRR